VKQRVVVEGVNVQKRHVKPRTVMETETAAPQTGGIIESEGSVHVSNVMLIDPKSGDPTRVGIRREDGKRVRFAKTSGEVID
jgi:large subunit ribosomal protein L24